MVSPTSRAPDVSPRYVQCGPRPRSARSRVRDGGTCLEHPQRGLSWPTTGRLPLRYIAGLGYLRGELT